MASCLARARPAQACSDRAVESPTPAATEASAGLVGIGWAGPPPVNREPFCRAGGTASTMASDETSQRIRIAVRLALARAERVCARRLAAAATAPRGEAWLRFTLQRDGVVRDVVSEVSTLPPSFVACVGEGLAGPLQTTIALDGTATYVLPLTHCGP